MKTKLSLLFLVSCFFYLGTAQVPQGFIYQAIARDGSGNILPNTPLQAMMYVQSLSTGGTIFWKELHSTITTNSFGLFTLVVGTGTRQTESTVATFNLIDWSVTPKYLRTEIYYSGSWKDMGTSQLMSVPYSMTAGDLAGSVDKLAVKGTTSGLEEALFEVKNKDGQTVFAVYNEGVRVYVSNGAKAVKGGFAVGGFGTDKAESTKYLFVGKDSVRIYLDTNPLTKKLKGGFAVGGYDITKGIIQDYLDVNSDSVRIYIDSDPATKKLKGGFAVGGYDMTKGTNINYMNVNTDASGIINPSQNRILWYPLKNAFLTGRVLIASSTNVGENSFATGYESRAKGMYSQAMGYKAIADGNSSTAIGKNASATKMNSFAFGDSPLADGLDSYAFGAGATASGAGSYAIGSAGRDTLGNLTGQMTTSSGSYSFAIGQGSRATNITAFALGANSIASGTGAFSIGRYTQATGIYSTALGFGARATGTYSTAIGIWSHASGWSSTAIGDSTTASAYNSTAIGSNTTAPSIFETAIGVWNTVYTPIAPDGWNGNDRIFVIGNGRDYYTKSNAMTILKNGCIGLQSVTNPTYALQLPNSSTIGVGSGRAYAWTTYSDSRLKENQVPLVYGLTEVMELNPKQYIHHSTADQTSWSDDHAPLSIGLVAQDVYKIIPEAVQVPEDDSKEFWGLDYDKLIPVLIRAIQEQQAQIDDLKTLVNNLIINQTAQVNE
ncbi:MAG: tail fiber domain-containing protein [Bacteroidia bacterium]|nr:tail fiber domain-containing protein [Bacteroidia bacterium]